MRTAIFLGLIFVAKAINNDSISEIWSKLAIIITVMILADIIDFVKKIIK